nr:exodeoxyribonuclease VII large subunit [Deltaproteobacteria bacterium]
MLRVLQARRAELGRFGAQMAALSPLAVLDRGYAMVSMAGSIVRATDQVRAGDHLRVRLARGELGVIVDEIGDAGGNEP